MFVFASELILLDADAEFSVTLIPCDLLVYINDTSFSYLGLKLKFFLLFCMSLTKNKRTRRLKP